MGSFTIFVDALIAPFTFVKAVVKEVVSAWTQASRPQKVMAVSYWAIAVPSVVALATMDHGKFDITVLTFNGLVILNSYLAGLYRLQDLQIQVLAPHQRTLFTLGTSYLLLHPYFENPSVNNMLIYSSSVFVLTLINNVFCNRTFFLSTVFVTASYSVILSKSLGWASVLAVASLGGVSFVFPSLEFNIEVTQHFALFVINVVRVTGQYVNFLEPFSFTYGGALTPFLYLTPVLIATFGNLFLVGGRTLLQHLVKHGAFLLSWIYMYALIKQELFVLYFGLLLVFITGSISLYQVTPVYAPFHKMELVANFSPILISLFVFKNSLEWEMLFYYTFHIGNLILLFVGDMEDLVYDELNWIARPFTRHSLVLLLSYPFLIALVTALYYRYLVVSVLLTVYLFTLPVGLEFAVKLTKKLIKN